MIPRLRSVPDPHALSTHLADRDGLGFTGCPLLRSLVNDVYEPPPATPATSSRCTATTAAIRAKSFGRQGFRRICRQPDDMSRRSCCCPTETRSDCSRHLKNPGRSSCPVSSRAPNRSRLSTTSCTTHSAGNSPHSTMPPTTTIRRTRDARPRSPIGSTNHSNRSWPSTPQRKTCSATSRPRYGATSRSTRKQAGPAVQSWAFGVPTPRRRVSTSWVARVSVSISSGSSSRFWQTSWRRA